MSKPFRVLVGARTDPGAKRENGDAFTIFEDRYSPRGPLIEDGFYAVADADGPSAYVEEAAKLVLTTISERIEPSLGEEEASLNALIKTAVDEAHDKLRERIASQNWGETRVSLAFVALLGSKIFFVSAGSCSLFLLRAEELRELSHRAPAVSGREVVVPALGVENFSCDVFEVRFHPGDSLLLASDGLVEKARYRDLAEVLHWSISPQAACDRLISLAARTGSNDNLTALVVNILEEKKPGVTNWWKIAIIIGGLLLAGFAITYILLIRRAPSEPTVTTASTTTPSGSASSELTSPETNSHYIFLSGLQDPYAILQYDTNFYVLDKGQQRVIALDSNGKPLADFDGKLAEAQAPCDMTVGNYVLLVLDAGGGLFEVDFQTGAARPVEIAMGDHGALSSPRAIDSDGSYYYIADRGNDRIVILDRNFGYFSEYGGSQDGKPILEKPNGIAVDQEGNLYVSLKDAHKVIKLDPKGQVIAEAGTGATSVGTYDGPADLALTFNEKQVLVPEMSTDQVLVFDSDLNQQYKVGRAQLEGTNFRDPKGLLATEQALYVVGGSSEDKEGYIWRIPWSLVLTTP